MTPRSLPHAGANAQDPRETAVERLTRLLPRRMRAADRDAMHGMTFQQPKRWALRQSEIAVNDTERILALVVDVDHQDAETAWMDADIAPPNIVTVSRRGHAHYLWLLDDEREGTIWVQRQSNAVRYAAAIQRALCRAVGGDLSYAWTSASTHNPRHDAYRAREVRRRPYRLAQLAVGLELAEPRYARQGAPHGDIPLERGSRNHGVFTRLLGHAARTMQRYRAAADYEQAMTELGQTLNAACNPPLDAKEVAGIVRSVLRYHPFRRRDRAAELKARRHAEGRSRESRDADVQWRRAEAVRMRAAGATIPAIAKELRVTSRTVDRYLADARAAEPTTIPVIPTQGDALRAGSAPGFGRRDTGLVRNLAKREHGCAMQLAVRQVGREHLEPVVDRLDEHAQREDVPGRADLDDELVRFAAQPAVQQRVRTPSPSPIPHGAGASKYATTTELTRWCASAGVQWCSTA